MWQRINLRISDRAHVILHIILSWIACRKRPKVTIKWNYYWGGPAYLDKAARVGIRITNLLDREHFQGTLGAWNLAEKNHSLRDCTIAQQLTRWFWRIHEYEAANQAVCDRHPSVILNGALDQGKRVLFEGGSGVMLDIDRNYPFCNLPPLILLLAV